MAEIVHAKDLRPGNTFLNNGNLYEVLENYFNKTAMREGIVKCKVRNLRTGSITIDVLTGGKFEKVLVENVKMSFSYIDGQNYVFMDNTTFETVEIPESRLQWMKNFLVEGVEVSVLKFGEEILGIKLPDQITCDLIDCEDAVQGNTVKAIMKKAHISTGFEVAVPQFVKPTDRIIIRTEDGTYVGRESK